MYIIEIYYIVATFSSILSDGFDETEFASRFVGSSAAKNTAATNVNSCIKRLTDHIYSVEKSIGTMVAENQTILLNTVTDTIKFKREIEPLITELTNLKARTSQIKGLITKPLNDMRNYTLQLERMQLTAKILRRVKAILVSLKKLQAMDMNSLNGRDLLKASVTIHDIEYCLKEDDMSGIPVVENQLPYVVQFSSQIRKSAMDSFQSGLSELNNTNISIAIQVFYNLNCLPARVNDAITWSVQSVLKSIQQVIVLNNTRNPSPQTLWDRIQEWSEVFHSCCLQMWTLERVLSKKREPNTRQTYAELLKKEGLVGITDTFTLLVGNAINNEFVSCPPKSFVYNHLVNEYKRLAEIIDNIYNRLSTSTKTVGMQQGITSKWNKANFLKGFEEFEIAFSRNKS